LTGSQHNSHYERFFQQGVALRFLYITGAVAVAFGLYLTSLYHYLLFHTLAETFTIVVAFGIFAVTWNAREFLRNNYLRFIGVSYLFVAGFDLVHAMSYQGMPMFQEYGPNLPTQLWIVARFLESGSLFIAPVFFHRRFRMDVTLAALAALSALVCLAIFRWNIFPVCFIPGKGLTTFKVVSEYVICAILLLSMARLLKDRDRFEPHVLQLVLWSIVITICSEIMFTFYVKTYDLSNLLGHYFKIVSFYLMYRAIIETGFTQPYSLLLRELKKEQEQLELDRQREAELVKEIRHFAYIVSHDLRAPLVNLSGFSAELKTAVEEVTPAVEVGLPLLPEDKKAAAAIALNNDIPESLDFISNAVERMDHLIGAILNLSRIGHRQLELEPLDINDIVHRTLETLAYQISQGGIAVSVGDLPQIVADRIAMEQIHASLLGNAVNYLDPGRPGIIEVTGERLDGETVFRVRDNGIGIAKHDQEKIFEIFQRAGAHNVPGEGVGLAYVRTLVRRHGGRIWVESEPGAGATFVFTIADQIAEESP